MTRQLVIGIWSLVICLFASGCARGPGTPTSVDRLTVEFTVLGQIDPDAHYFIAFDDDGDSTDGPLPAVVRPFGNGWGTGSFTRFVEIARGQVSLFENNPNDPLQPIFLGRPLRFRIERSRVEVVIDMRTFFAQNIPERVDINIIAVDEIILDPNFEGVRQFDALGETGNEFITIRLRGNFEFRNGQGVIREEAEDTFKPELDITDWRIIVERGR